MPDINKAYSWAVATCNAPNVGYSQSYRNAQTVGGITYYDCSSFINYALLAGGFETPSYAPKHNAFTTYSEPSELLRLGFREVDAGGEYLAGDIGLSNGHTEMCYRGGSGKGVFMGAHTDNAPLANQVSIGSSGGNPDYERSFPRLFRYGDGGATGYGASAYVIAALAGNAWRESHINPTLSQLGGGAFVSKSDSVSVTSSKNAIVSSSVCSATLTFNSSRISSLVFTAITHSPFYEIFVHFAVSNNTLNLNERG
jgi:hypothetical protein